LVSRRGGVRRDRCPDSQCGQAFFFDSSIGGESHCCDADEMVSTFTELSPNRSNSFMRLLRR
jgi:hypothetical protein